MEQPTNNFHEEEEISFIEIFFRYFHHWPWFLISIALCVGVAWAYLRYTTPEYKVVSKVLIKDDKKGQNAADILAFSDLGIANYSSNLDNEIEVLKSKTLMTHVKDKLNLGVNYIKEGRIRQSDIYVNTPIFVYVTDQVKAGRFIISQLDEKTLSIDSEEEAFHATISIPDEGEDSSQIAFEDEVVSPWGILSFEVNPFGERNLPIDVILSNPKSLPVVQIAPINKSSSVVEVSIVTESPQKGKDIVNTLIQTYNDQVIEEQQYVASNTIKFIEERLGIISGELEKAELNVERYMQEKGVTDLQAQAQLFLSSSSEYDQKISQAEIQFTILQGIKNWIMAPENEGEVAPSNVGLTDQTILGLMSRYNQEIMDKKRSTVGMTETNPTVIEYDVRIASLRDDLIKGVSMAESSMRTNLNELRRKENVYVSKARGLPTQERESRELYRQQSIKETLVLYLMQKQEETGLSLAMAVPNATVIDPADYSNIPVKPKKNVILLAALLLGLIIPILIIYVRDLFDTKIHTKEDVLRIVKIPFLGDIPVSKKDTIFPVKSVRSGIAERFRLVASNVNFIAGHKENTVIMVTSTFPEEGKSFFSRNLAYSLATIGHKVLLIDMDMRKSVMNNLLEMKAEKGIAYYLSNPDVTIREVTEQKEYHPNLNILPVKIYPPNPAELIASSRVSTLFDQARSRYDYIVVDTAPIGLVADAFTISKYVDATIFVTRADVTYKNALRDLQTYYKERKLTKLAIVLNAVKTRRGYGNYNYGDYKNTYYRDED